MKTELIQVKTKDKLVAKILIRVKYSRLESIFIFGSWKKICKPHVLHTRDGGENWFFQDTGQYADAYWLSSIKEVLRLKRLEQQKEDALSFRVTRIHHRR